jgi:hypothetical protein
MRVLPDLGFKVERRECGDVHKYFLYYIETLVRKCCSGPTVSGTNMAIHTPFPSELTSFSSRDASGAGLRNNIYTTPILITSCQISLFTLIWLLWDFGGTPLASLFSSDSRLRRC